MLRGRTEQTTGLVHFTLSFAVGALASILHPRPRAARPGRAIRPAVDVAELRNLLSTLPPVDLAMFLPNYPQVETFTYTPAGIKVLSNRVFAQDFAQPGSNNWLTGPNRFMKPNTNVQVVRDGDFPSGYALEAVLPKNNGPLRHPGIGVDVSRYGIKGEFYMKSLVKFSPQDVIDDGVGVKLVWLNATRNKLNDQANYVIRMDSNWNTFAAVDNRPASVLKPGEGFPGDSVLRQRGQIGTFSGSPGAQSLLKGKSVKDYMLQGVHVVEVYAKMNTVGKSDGVLKFWLDGVPVISAANMNFTHNKGEGWGEINPFGMYGGGPPKAGDFRVRLGGVEFWNSLPPWRR